MTPGMMPTTPISTEYHTPPGSLVAAAALFAASFVLRSHLIVVSDNVSWILHGAKVLLGEGPFHRNFFEDNPPLIVYLNTPAVLLAEGLGLTPHNAFLLAVHALAFVSYALSLRWLGPPLGSKARARGLALWLGFLLLVFPGADFGEREHLLILFTAPYFLSMAARVDGYPAGRMQVVPITLMAAVGLLIKPYFLMALGTGLAYGYFRNREIARRCVLDGAVVAAVALAYVLFIVVFHAAYLSDVVPLAIEYYQGIVFPLRLGTTFILTGMPAVLLVYGLKRGGKR